ncbi:hypothetical protein CJF42_06180 [Pseudoalteromonas sp. NBT06-2]|nr:hypothetical protein CJF42_06180 [Pseudoalteromonas sp. NBT06-2]
MAFEPQTLYDILEKTPGANRLLNSMNNTSQNRGFGSVGDQILINSKRMSGKENNIANELDNIQAKDIDYIELIRGARSDLDVQNNGLSHTVNPTELSSSEQFISPEQTHTQTNTRIRENLYKEIQLSTKLEYLYPNHFKMQDSVGIRNALGKALIEEHGYSLFKINNAA